MRHNVLLGRQIHSALTPTSIRSIPSIQKRSFFPFPLPTQSTTPQILVASRTLPYPPRPLFETVASVDAYGRFLPFTKSSVVTKRDQHGYPAEATMNVGYAGFEESFRSEIRCVEGSEDAEWRVEAKCGDEIETSPSGESLFEFLRTTWRIRPLGNGLDGQPRSKVDLNIEVKFRNPVYAALMKTVEGKVAGTMMEAFEERVKDHIAKRR